MRRRSEGFLCVWDHSEKVIKVWTLSQSNVQMTTYKTFGLEFKTFIHLLTLGAVRPRNELINLVGPECEKREFQGDRAGYFKIG